MLCLLPFLVGCNLPLASPPQEAHVKTLGDVAQRLEQQVIKFDNLRNQFEVQALKSEVTIKSQGDVQQKQEQNLAKVEGHIKVLTTMSAEFKSTIELAGQKAGGDAPRQTGVVNILLDHGGTYASVGLAVVLGYMGFKYRNTSRARKNETEAAKSVVQGVEAGTQKLAEVLRGINGISEGRAKSLAMLVKQAIQDTADKARTSPVVRDWVESNGHKA